MEKKLYRSRNKKVVAGIAGGLGEYLDIDPIIIRIIIVLITIFHGIGILIYIIMWIVIPEEPFENIFNQNKDNPSPDSFSEKINDAAKEAQNAINSTAPSSNGRIIIGVIFIFIGIFFLSEKFFPFLDFEFVFAIGLIAFGVTLLFNFFNKSEKSS